MAGNQVTLTFAGEAEKLSRTFRGVDREAKDLDRSLSTSSKKLAGSIGKFAKVAALGAGAGVVALGAFAFSALEAGEALNSIRSQSEAVIKSTGGVANVSAQHIQDYADELSNLAAVDRKIIESGQNVLLTFTNIRNEVGEGNDVFDQATLAALDMSAALGKDMQSSIEMVGKALNDPIKGLSGLSKAGVQFTEEQQAQIKTLAESGDVLGAQKIILGELETQFAGSAAANADSSDKIRLAFQKIQEEIGLALLPILDRFTDWVLNDGIPAMRDFASWVGENVVPKLQELGGWLKDNVVPALQDLGGWIKDTVVPALQDLAQWFGENQTVLEAAAIGILAMLVPAFVAWAITAGAAAIATLLAIAPLVLIGIAVGVLAFLIITHWDTIKRWTSIAWEFVKNVTTTVWDAVSGFLSSTWQGIKDTVTTAIDLVKSIVTGAWDSIKGTTQAAWDLIKSYIIDPTLAAKNFVDEKIDDIVGFFTGLPGRVTSALSGLVEAFKSPFRRAFQGIKTLWNTTLGGKGINIPGFLGFGGISFTIPKLAQGGVVSAREGGVLAQLAEGGQDEAVIPLDRLERMMGVGSKPVVLDIRSDDSEVGDLLLQLLRESVQTRGGDAVQVLEGAS